MRDIDGLSVREALRVARRYIYIGDPAAAVRLILDAAAEILQKSPGLFDAKSGASTWHAEGACPALGAGLAVKNGKVYVVWGKTEFTVSEATSYYYFLKKLLDQSRSQYSYNRPPHLVSWRAKGAQFVVRMLGFSNVWSSSILKKISPTLPLKVKDIAISFLSGIQFLSHKFIATKSFDEKIAAIGLCLHEPKEAAEEIYKKSMVHMAFRYLNDQSPSRSRRYIESFRNRMCWQNERLYSDYIATRRESKIVVTIHLGCTELALMRITLLQPAGSKVISLLQFERSKKGQDFMVDEHAARGIKFQEIALDQHNPLETIAALRAGNTTLTLYFDLSTHFGETMEVNFLGRKAQFSRGPAELAIVGRAPIYPVFTFDDNGAHYIEAHEAIDVHVHPGESLRQASSRITQQLVALSERYIRRYPAQWCFICGIANHFAGKGGQLLPE